MPFQIIDDLFPSVSIIHWHLLSCMSYNCLSFIDVYILVWLSTLFPFIHDYFCLAFLSFPWYFFILVCSLFLPSIDAFFFIPVCLLLMLYSVLPFIDLFTLACFSLMFLFVAYSKLKKNTKKHNISIRNRR